MVPGNNQRLERWIPAPGDFARADVSLAMMLAAGFGGGLWERWLADELI